MLTKLMRKLTAAPTAEFCDSCAEVCTPQCRAQAHLDRTKARVAYQFSVIR